VEAFVSTDMPLFITNNPAVRNILLKYNQEYLLDESELRKNHLPEWYETKKGKKVKLSL
jgi:hypothetical protein